MGTRKEKLFLASIWPSWSPRLLSRTFPVLQGSNARDEGQVASWWVKWHFLKETQKEKLFLASIGTSWTPRLLSGTISVLQFKRWRTSWWVEWQFLKETPKEKFFLASIISMSWKLRLHSGNLPILQGSKCRNGGRVSSIWTWLPKGLTLEIISERREDLGDYRNDLDNWWEDFKGGGRAQPPGSHASDWKGTKLSKAQPAARRA